jgi:eukaryotic-like serine/threonine-protein kinase
LSTPSTLIADRYRLVKLLGTGGMGIVWQAWDERLQRPVALKMLRTQPELTDREHEVATSRAMREARITAGLHHPHAVTVFDVVEHKGQPCIVMQLIESTPLSVLLREHGPLTPREAARIGAQVSSALAAAHKMRIVHRDVKPGNILITEDGSAMMSDFGISHALGDTTITATGMIHGTPAFLAPEVARGQDSSFASDVFSLGSTLYTMLEGAPPFGAEQNAIALLHKVARGYYPAPKHAGVLAPLLGDMLSTDPKRRPSMKSIASRMSAMYEGTEATEAAVATEAPGASESPTVPLGGAAVALAVDGPPTVAAETRAVGATAETERLDRATPGTERLQAPTAETDRLTGAAASPALEWLVQGPPAPPQVDARELDPQRPGRRRAGALVGILILAGILGLGGAILFGALRDGAVDAGGPVTSAEPTTSETPAAEMQSPQVQPAPAAPSPSPPLAEETEEEVPEEPQPPSTEQRLVESITTYYAMVPGELDSAWPMMTADYQENHVGGRDAYDFFWGGITDVAVADVTASAPDRAQATLTYYFTDGRVVQEVTGYRLVEEGGVLKIAETTVLSSAEL